MKVPEGLETLLDYGVIQQVIRPLMSGKEAQVYVVVAGGEECVAKVYKESDQRTFRHRADYTEGRRTRNTRDQRAMAKRTRHGRKQDEAAWRSTEVDMIHRLKDAGVRVPEPINFVDGVLVMELVKDATGAAAPRLGDLEFSAEEAKEIYHGLIRETVKMLCAGVIHGDLSDFNVLMGADGPVVIDFPQAVDPTQNRNAEKLLLRDVENLHRFLARFAPGERRRAYGEEIWALYQANRLDTKTPLSGEHRAPSGKVDTSEVTALIQDADRDERRRRRGPEDDEADEDAEMGRHFAEEEQTSRAEESAGPPRRRVVDFTAENRSERERGRGRKSGSRPRDRSARQKTDSPGAPVIPSGPAATRSGGDGGAARGPRAERGRRGARKSPRPAAEPGANGRDVKPSSAEEAAKRRRPRRRRGRRSASEDGAGRGTPRPSADGAGRGTPRPSADGAGRGTPRPSAGGAGRGTPRPSADGAGGDRSAAPAERPKGPARPKGSERDRPSADGRGPGDRPPGRRSRRRRKPRAPE